MHADPVMASDSNVEIAIKICTSNEFKRILQPRAFGQLDVVKKYWDRTIERQALILLRTYELSKDNHEEVLGFVFCIAMRMLAWIKYFNGTFELSADFYVDVLTDAAFTPEGIIDEAKVATVLIEDKNLTAKQKFLLACHYCMKEKMPALLKTITREERQTLYALEESDQAEQYGLIKFWCYYLMGEIDKLKKKKSLNEFRLDCAIASGSIIAIKYCLEKTTLSLKKDSVAYAVSKILKAQAIRYFNSTKTNIKFLNDWMPFSREYDLYQFSYIPSHYSTDILFHLFPKLTSTEKTNVLEKFFRSDEESLKSGSNKINFVNFLFWPHQDEFMELISFSWNFLPENNFGALLLEISKRIEAKKGTLFYYEDKCYDYRQLLRQFWCSSPGRLQQYIFSYKKMTATETGVLEVRYKIMVKVGMELILNLYNLPNFTSEDNLNIKTFLSILQFSESEIFIESPYGKYICTTLLQKSKFELFNELIFTCFCRPEDAIQFRKTFGIVAVKSTCLSYIEHNQWDEAEKAVNWTGDLSEMEIENLKESIVRSLEGKELCRQLFIRNEESGNWFLRWGVPKESITDYKVRLLIEADGMMFHKKLLGRGNTHFVHALVNCCLIDKIEKRCFKAELVKEIGFSVCRKLIVDNVRPNMPGDGIVSEAEDTWEPVNRFLTWCLPSRNKLLKFKKDLFASPDGKEIIFDLMIHDSWNGIEQYLTWLNLIPKEIKKLKEDLLRHKRISDFVDGIMETLYPLNKGGLTTLGNFIKCFLTHKKAVKEFESRYHRYLNDSLLYYSLKLARGSLGMV